MGQPCPCNRQSLPAKLEGLDSSFDRMKCLIFKFAASFICLLTPFF